MITVSVVCLTTGFIVTGIAAYPGAGWTGRWPWDLVAIGLALLAWCLAAEEGRQGRIKYGALRARLRRAQPTSLVAKARNGLANTLEAVDGAATTLGFLGVHLSLLTQIATGAVGLIGKSVRTSRTPDTPEMRATERRMAIAEAASSLACLSASAALLLALMRWLVYCVFN